MLVILTLWNCELLHERGAFVRTIISYVRKATSSAQLPETQAQVQEPQEQVGEVQVGNVNSANSPVVVS